MALTLCTALALGACKGSGQAQQKRKPKARKKKPAYPAAAMLRALRPGVARQVRRQAALGHITDLPYYDMELTVHPLQARLDGKYVLHYLNRTGASMRMLPLLMHPNTPRELGGTTGGQLAILSAKTLSGPAVKLTRRRLTLAVLTLASPLAPGKRIKVEVKFSGALRRLPHTSNDIFQQAMASMGVSGAGSGASDYGLLATGDGILTIASAYPMVAPFRGGKFDMSPPTRFGDLAYNDLANFRVRVSLPAGYTLVTNLRDGRPGKVDATTGRTVTEAAGAANRDLVLVAGKTLKQLTRRVGKVLVRSTFLAGDQKVGKLVLDTTAGSLRLFQKRFGPYPYTELDTAEATLVGGAGGVEFNGMQLVAGMLYRKPSRSASPMGQLMKMMGNLGNLLGGGLQGRGAVVPASGMKMLDKMVLDMAVFTTAHEVAHQYFAGLVGADCRAHPAVDEPLAQFAAGEYMIQKHGKVRGRKLMDNNAKLNYALYRLMGGRDRPAAQRVSKFPSPLSYAAIVYGKAPYFYVALKKKLGARRLNKALRHAVDRSRFKLVTTDQWIAHLERGAGGPRSGVRPLARRWLRQAHGDKDLGVDGSGDLVLGQMLGKKQYAELKRSLAMLGFKPRDLFRMLMGKMMAGER